MAQKQGISQKEGKERVLTKSRSSVTSSISDALVMKSDRIFFLCQSNGLVPDEKGHGHGLYYDDTRYLGVYTFHMNGTTLDVLASSDEAGDAIRHLLINPDLHDDNDKLVSKESITVSLHRSLNGDDLTLEDNFQIDNFALEPFDLTVAIETKPDFASVFDVRGMLGQKPGTLHEASTSDEGITFAYSGADSFLRKLDIHFEPKPAKIEGHQAIFKLHLDARGSAQLKVRVQVTEEGPTREEFKRSRGEDRGSASDDREKYLRNRTQVHTSSSDAEDIINASFRDLRVLQTQLDGETFFAAGVPWFVTLFGRDTLLTAIQTLAYNPLIAKETLSLMAKFQGKHQDRWTEEEPGKILHALRQDELTNIGEVPYKPYYGTVDATVLFLLLFARHARWTGSLDLFHQLQDNIQAGLKWVDEYGDSDGDGYLDYNADMPSGLINEGWKDSSDSMVTASGDLAQPPIAPAEVQGYVYAAKMELAEIYEQADDNDTAKRLRQEASELKQRFNRDYWLEDQGMFAMALEKGMRPLAVGNSNAGQVLWSGIADEDKALSTIRRLMEDDMFSGWGVRTLSKKERRYSPISYHLGSVWPHDNSIILGGLRRLKRDDDASRIFQAIMEAARYFSNARLPELFCGFSRDEYARPVQYPVACHPQAWATGAVPYMLEQSLGLKPDGFNNRLIVDRPCLPEFIPDVELEHLKVGRGECHLRFERAPGGQARVTIISADNLAVSITDAA